MNIVIVVFVMVEIRLPIEAVFGSKLLLTTFACKLCYLDILLCPNLWATTVVAKIFQIVMFLLSVSSLQQLGLLAITRSSFFFAIKKSHFPPFFVSLS